MARVIESINLIWRRPGCRRGRPTIIGRGLKVKRIVFDYQYSERSASPEEIRRHGHVLTPGRYVGAEPQPDDGEPFEEKMARLTAQWREQQADGRRLDAAIEENLTRLGLVRIGEIHGLRDEHELD